MRHLVLGDTHGAYLALQQVLQQANYVRGVDKLVVLGDTFDGWSGAPEIIEFYRSLGSDLVYVLGNHDVVFLEWMAAGQHRHPMEDHGGRITRELYTGPWAHKAEEHRQWLMGQRAYYIDGKNRLYVHAGWDPRFAFEDPRQLANNAYWWTRTFWETMMHMPTSRVTPFSEVFIGHTPTYRFETSEPYRHQPMHCANVWNIDTGSGFKGVLTLMDAETKEFWQSAPCHTLYPAEAGRN